MPFEHRSLDWASVALLVEAEQPAQQVVQDLSVEHWGMIVEKRPWRNVNVDQAAPLSAAAVWHLARRVIDEPEGYLSSTTICTGCGKGMILPILTVTVHALPVLECAVPLPLRAALAEEFGIGIELVDRNEDDGAVDVAAHGDLRDEAPISRTRPRASRRTSSFRGSDRCATFGPFSSAVFAQAPGSGRSRNSPSGRQEPATNAGFTA